MNLDVDLFSKLLDATYGTALDDNRWSDLFDLMKETTGVEHFVLHGYDNNLQSNTVAALQGYDPTYISSFEDYYWDKNPWLPGIAKAPIGKAVYAEDFCPEDILRSSEFYNDWVRPLDDVGTGGGIVLFRDDTRFLSVGGNIKFSQRDNMQSNWLGLLDLLSPHLRNAFEMRRQLAGRQLTDATYLKALDAIGNAVFLLNASCCLSYSNPAGQQLLKANSLVYLDAGGTLRTHEPNASRVLGKALHLIGLKLAPADSQQIVLHSKDGTTKAVATLAPFAPDPGNIDRFADFAAGDVPVAILTVTDPERKKKPPRQVLAALYRLSPAETDLALALSAGESLKDYADRRQVSRHTVRNQLRKVFDKTGTNSQARLVSELNRLF